MVLSVCVAYEVFMVMNFDLSDCLITIINSARILQIAPHLNMSSNLRTSLKRILALVASAIVILSVRLYVNGEGSPLFMESDNPASFSTHWLTRALTYAYLCGLNAWLLLFPSRLCFDWSMGSIPLVDSISDERNCLTLTCALILFLLLFYKGKWNIKWWEVKKIVLKKYEKNDLIPVVRFLGTFWATPKETMRGWRK